MKTKIQGFRFIDQNVHLNFHLHLNGYFIMLKTMSVTHFHYLADFLNIKSSLKKYDYTEEFLNGMQPLLLMHSSCCDVIIQRNADAAEDGIQDLNSKCVH